MEKDPNDSDSKNSSSVREVENDQSFVGKFKNHVSEIISNTPLSKWFRKENIASAVRRRDEEADDDEFYDLQPPTKKTRLPETNLNFTETLSPIHNNIANRISLKSFPEPVAGPSGYSARKFVNSNSLLVRDTHKNGDVVKSGNKDSDSEESTSDYSSAHIGSKEIVSQQSSKQTSPLQSSPAKLRSLFQNSSLGRTLFADHNVSTHNSSLSSRMPSYKTPSDSANFADRTLSTKKIINSPFYSGRTIYGGASAYGKSINKPPQDLRSTLNNSIQIKPVNRSAIDKSHLQLGKTARRILDTLEQYSTPVMDAKKIPVTPNRFREGILSKYTGANPYTVRGHKTSSNKELQVPSVTDLLKMKQSQQKLRLQDSTEAVRQIATQSKSVLNETETTYKILNVQEQEKHTGKIKSKIGNVRQKAPVHEESVPELPLNPIALPIKEMPKFNFTLPPLTTPLSSLADRIKILSPNKKDSSKTTPEGSIVSKPINSNRNYKFSAPLVLGECLKSLNAYNNFKFSEPLCKKRRSIHPEIDAKLVIEKKNNGESVLLKAPVNATSLADQFKPAKDTWECSTCLIRNQSDKMKCLACETPKPDPIRSKDVKVASPTAKSLFDEKVKPPTNTWECPVCMIRNKNDIAKCAACDSPKPGNAPKTSASSKLFVIPPTAALSAGFGSKFAPPPSTWECQICMIRNKDEINKCAACETARPSGSKSLQSSTFGDTFKKQDKEWECEACMVRNKSSTDKCVCCESLRPGASGAPSDGAKKASTFNFGIDKATASSFTFGVPAQSQPSFKSTTTSAPVFGIKSESTGSQSFSFGLPNRATSDGPKSDLSETSKEKKSEAAPLTTTTISVGSASKAIEPVVAKKPSAGESKEQASPAPKADAKPSAETQRLNPLLKAGEKLPEKALPASAGFSFRSTVPSPQPTASTKNKTDTEGDDSPTKKLKPVAMAIPATPGLFSIPPKFNFKPPSIESKEEVKLTGSPNFSFTPTKTKAVSTALSNQTSSPSSATDKPKAPSFNFGSADSSNLRPTVNFTRPAADQGIVLFGGQTTAPPKTFSFGSSSAVKQEPAKTPSFAFAGSAPVENKPSSGFSFGNNTVPPAPDAAKTQSFPFGQTNSDPTFGQSSAFGQNASTTSIFGQASSNTSSFGQSTSAIPAFGPTSSTTQQPTAFGSTNSTAQQSTPFAPPNATTQQQPTVFGQTQPIAGFGQNNSTAQQPSAFGQTAAPSFGFGAKPAEAFGSSQASAPNGVFNFGSGAVTSNQTTGFSFGAANTSAPQNIGFNFGTSTSAATPSGGFSFSGAPPTFDVNAKPSFNFTGGSGVTAFSAPPPADGGHQPRKFKKAIRRTQVR